ncbi:MAG: TatD family hydrolase, partial [Calditrichia bacterium]
RDDLDEVIARARQAGVNSLITLGTDLTSSRETLAIAKQYKGVFAAAGIHPSEVHLTEPHDAERIREMAEAEEKIVAIGEIGLDFYWEKEHAGEQYRIFREMLFLAQALNLPVVIHNRSAHREMQWFFQEEKTFQLEGVMHCFSGNQIDARFYLEMGLHISFTGNITYPDYKMLDVLKYIPLDRILLETDSPYMPPEPFRKQRNEPAYVTYVAEKLAEVYHKAVPEIAEITTENAQRLFNLSVS